MSRRKLRLSPSARVSSAGPTEVAGVGSAQKAAAGSWAGARGRTDVDRCRGNANARACEEQPVQKRHHVVLHVGQQLAQVRVSPLPVPRGRCARPRGTCQQALRALDEAAQQRKRCLRPPSRRIGARVEPAELRAQSVQERLLTRQRRPRRRAVDPCRPRLALPFACRLPVRGRHEHEEEAEGFRVGENASARPRRLCKRQKAPALVCESTRARRRPYRFGRRGRRR